MRVSGNRPPTQDRLKAVGRQTGKVGLARITYLSDQQAVCSCGWPVSHKRSKVLEDRIDRHLSEKHAGRGIRL